MERVAPVLCAKRSARRDRSPQRLAQARTRRGIVRLVAKDAAAEASAPRQRPGPGGAVPASATSAPCLVRPPAAQSALRRTSGRATYTTQLTQLVRRAPPNDCGARTHHDAIGYADHASGA
eukprot:scaffold307_cov390-Prasinococcus_capsulatus_cf.AAC.8